MNCAAVILAAGASTRLGQPKQLIEYRGETLISRAQRLAYEAGAGPIFVVTGAVEDLPTHANATLIHNAEWQTGMASSVRAGVDALGKEIDAVLLLTCDQPAITADHLRALILSTAETQAISASAYAHRIGVPAVFPRRFFEQLKTLTGDEGARKLLQSDDVLTFALPGGEFDIDTPQDLARWHTSL